MSSSAIVRRLVFEDAPQVIENTFEWELEPQDEDVAGHLVEALQQEHPDAEPEEIEDAVQEAIEHLLSSVASPDFETPSSEPIEELAFDEPEPRDAEAEAAAEALATMAPDADAATLLADARREAAEITDKAQAEASQVLAEADSRAAEIQRAAYDKGYQEGLDSGKAAGEQQAANLLEQVTGIVDGAAKLHDAMLRDAESEMVALCLEIARKIIQAELRTNPDVVKSVVGAAVQKINGSPRVTIKVHPDQAEAVRTHWLRAYGPNYREKEWAIEGDAAVEAGGCVLATKYGSLDAQIGTQFSEIQKTFALLLGTGN